ncbi:putative transmembrane protein [Anaeromyxobacter dehalogenans 2CP-1]|uniref:Transmembrane protein n=1 Tax=Anaeromyxobacter dehalogenans (strain ATCC BAA-258 / DSM 21875 / 2CP-1) TaxID=455488 RepID=B8JA63_ANAD2|nr:putative transmembrane protein [Anaeromyxobacter dehalogenans 2CP-1]
MWGVTVDDPWNTAPTVQALARLPRRPTARIVFDLRPRATDYAAPVAAIRRAADVMGLLVDSSDLASLPPDAYAARLHEYLDALWPLVDVWEVGNEVNGQWTGDSRTVAAKVALAHAAVKARGGRTAITLHYDGGCSATPPDRGAFRWAARHLSPGLRREVDYVWLSYYEDECPGTRPDWRAVFGRLGTLFPRAALGIGECGAEDARRRPGALARCYRIRAPHPRFVGGYFWWHFSEDMVPASRPLWRSLASLVPGDAEARALPGARRAR